MYDEMLLPRQRKSNGLISLLANFTTGGLECKPMWEEACQSVKAFCRSELAREKLTDAAFIQEARVIVDVFREQARSYRRRCTLN